MGALWTSAWTMPVARLLPQQPPTRRHHIVPEAELHAARLSLEQMVQHNGWLSAQLNSAQLKAQAQEQVIATQAAWLVDLQRQLHAAQWQQQLAQEQHRRERSSWEAAAAARARCEADAQAQAFQARITKAGREALACEAAAAAEAALWQQLDAAQQRPDALEMDLWTLHEQLAAAHADAAQAGAEADALRGQLRSTEEQVAAARADCAERDEAIAGLTSRCHQAEEATQAAQQQAAAAGAESHAQVKELEAQLAATTASAAKAGAHARALQRPLRSAVAQLAAAAMVRREREREFAFLATAVVEGQEETEALQQRLEAAQAAAQAGVQQLQAQLALERERADGAAQAAAAAHAHAEAAAALPYIPEALFTAPDRVLGGGMFGIVEQRRMLVAVKRVSEARWEATLRAEAQWCATVAGHRNIARALGHTRIGGGFGLVMELAHSDLQALVSRGVLGYEEVRRIVWHLAAGLAHMHGLGLAHHDVKPANVLIMHERQPGGAVQTTVKLADLGLAGPLAQTRAQAARGTTQYLHPRHLIQETSCGSHDDAWALGYLVCECLGAEHPWFALARQLDAVLADPIRLLLLQHFCATHAVSVGTWVPEELRAPDNVDSWLAAVRAALCAGYVRMPRLAPRAGVAVPEPVLDVLDALFSPERWDQGVHISVQQLAAAVAR